MREVRRMHAVEAGPRGVRPRAPGRGSLRAVLALLGVIVGSLAVASAAAACEPPPSGHWEGRYTGSFTGEWNASLTFQRKVPDNGVFEETGSLTATTEGSEVGTINGYSECGDAHVSVLWPNGYIQEVTGSMTPSSEASGSWSIPQYSFVYGSWEGRLNAASESEGTRPGPVELVNPTGTNASSLTVEPVEPASLPEGIVAPAGALSFSISQVTHGGTIQVTLKLPAGSNPTAVYKWDGSKYSLYPPEKVSINGDELTLSLTDNEAPWDEAPELGVIRDPVIPVTTQPGTPPTVTKIAPSKGKAVGGKTVKIAGTGFEGVTRVSFGSSNAPSFQVTSASSLTAVSPGGISGPVDVRVWTESGGSPTSSADTFTFEGPVVNSINPDFGDAAGGTAVTVRGAGFVPGSTSFKFGHGLATTVDCPSSTLCTMVSPPSRKGQTGLVDVIPVAAGKKGKVRPSTDRFEYR